MAASFIIVYSLFCSYSLCVPLCRDAVRWDGLTRKGSQTPEQLCDLRSKYVFNIAWIVQIFQWLWKFVLSISIYEEVHKVQGHKNLIFRLKIFQKRQCCLLVSRSEGLKTSLKDFFFTTAHHVGQLWESNRHKTLFLLSDFRRCTDILQKKQPLIQKMQFKSHHF